ncbi:LysM peptidoglycan-binding domain-containing protein [Noviherbaspirillum autotrophicum]|uniref:LysM domain-containing protein n=1 Tax=Noviherbaspirillum autotrophicum TaxID=709839 RepID=A0A0C1YRF1_9BURK|nr:N-acetylmuramidase domain-containing protein [Noviherbaspirillum autotrophicum]KIF83242.1 hypothetical protein TSA66_24315 [Noviherbaspirillum autotrophicum]
MRDFHIVQEHETLSKIAMRHGTTVATLIKLNNLPNPNRLKAGQKIALRKEAVCGFETLFLDADRNPISNLEYILEYCGKSVKGSTIHDGKSQKIMTDWPTDAIRILVKRFDGTFKRVTAVMSGYGNKLCTLVSPLVVINAELHPHPQELKEQPVPYNPVKPVYGTHNPPKPKADTRDPGIQTKAAKTANGQPLTVAEGDIPRLEEFLDEYIGGDVTQSDIEDAAKELQCQPGLIYALAKQESSSSSFFKLGNRMVPKILYERHQFKNRTSPKKKLPSPYENKYPDICGPAYSRAKKNKRGEWIELKSGAILMESDVYGPSGIFQYKRLSKAYQLDPFAALEACSWGKFQIMGFNYKRAGFNDVKAFTKAMSRSDVEHIKAFLKFAKSNKVLLNGLRMKNFEKIAEGHNGENWRNINPEYASNLEKFYIEYNSKK